VGGTVTPTSWQYADAVVERRREAMAKTIRCECGFVARGESDDQVISVIRGHMATDHPALLDSVSRDDLLAWIQPE
jgi:predicted small metal-binding protein